jgi:hypothetical protein
MCLTQHSHSSLTLFGFEFEWLGLAAAAAACARAAAPRGAATLVVALGPAAPPGTATHEVTDPQPHRVECLCAHAHFPRW